MGMTKRGMARMTQRLQFLEKVNSATKDSLVELLQTTFSAIATMDPTLGLSILDQLNDQREQIQTLKDDRKKQTEDYVTFLASKLSDTMELEDDTAQDETDEEGDEG